MFLVRLERGVSISSLFWLWCGRKFWLWGKQIFQNLMIASIDLIIHFLKKHINLLSDWFDRQWLLGLAGWFGIREIMLNFWRALIILCLFEPFLMLWEDRVRTQSYLYKTQWLIWGFWKLLVLVQDWAKLLSTNKLYGTFLMFLGLKLTRMELSGEVLVYQLVEVFSSEVWGNILGVFLRFWEFRMRFLLRLWELFTPLSMLEFSDLED